MPSTLQQQDYKILVLFGTRPELIKLAPVISALKNHEKFQTVVVSSSQHTDLLTPFLRIFDVKTDYDLEVMSENQTPNAVAAKVLCRLDEILEIEKPDLILVQGDTTTAMSGALAGFNVKATFFVLGWIAEQNPALIREIVSRGHEIASRGFYHRSVKHLTPDEFREDLRRTNQILEDAGGQKIIGYRSAEKLVYEKDAWILDILAEEGLVYDASFLPSAKDEKQKRFAHQIQTNEKIIWEFPYSTRNLGFGLLPISGGNYFRQIPFTMLRHAVQDWHKRYDAPFVLYFHVWELDPEQPRISAASHYNRVRHYRKLDKMEWVLKEYFRRYDFTNAAELLNYELRITN